MIEEFNDYTDYLKTWIASRPNKGYGVKKKISSHLGVQLSYLSQVLSGAVVLNEDHAVNLSEFLELTDVETDYLLQMISLKKASSVKLQTYYERKLNELRNKLVASSEEMDRERLVTKNYSDYVQYFSDWVYSYVHTYSSIKPIDCNDLAHLLHDDPKRCQKILDYLDQIDLIYQKDGKYVYSGEQLMMPRHHYLTDNFMRSWKLKSLDFYQSKKPGDIQGCSVVSMSEEDAKKFRDKLLRTVKAFNRDVKRSKKEKVCLLTVDFLSLN